MNNEPIKINLNKKNTLFYLLNVFHDVIHDYGPGSAEDRWFKNQYIVKSFYEGAFTMSVPIKEEEEEKEEEIVSKKPRTFGGRIISDLTSSISPLESQQMAIKQPETQQVQLKELQLEQPLTMLPTLPEQPRRKVRGLARGIEQNNLLEEAKPMSLTSSQISYFEAKNELDGFLSSLKNNLEFNAFNIIQNDIFENTTNKKTPIFPMFDLSTYINCYKLAYMIVFFPQHDFEQQKMEPQNINFDHGDLNFDVTNIEQIPFTELKNKFVENLTSYLFNVNQIYSPIYKKNTYSSQEILNILTNFINAFNIEKSIAQVCQVPEDIKILQWYETPNDDYEENMMELAGGKGKRKLADETNLSIEDYKSLVNDITNYISSDETKSMIDNLKQIIGNSDRSPNVLENYKNNRAIIQNQVKNFLSEKGETKKMGVADNLIKPLQPRYNERLVAKEIEKFDETFKEQLSKILIDYEQQIQLSIEAEEKLRQKELEQQAKGEVDKLLEKLSPDDCKVRENFCSTIAKLGLFLNGVCDSNGNVISENLLVEPSSYSKSQSKLIKGRVSDNNTHNDFVKTQMDILLYYAGWNKNSANSNFGNVKSMSLDDELFDFVSYQYKIYNPKIIPNSTILCSKCEKYGIDNAADIDNDVRNKIFCPYTSVLDGMKQCSYKGAIGRMEYGNMNFRVGLDDGYYQGKVAITQEATKGSKKSDIVSYELILKPLNNSKIFTIDSPNMSLSGDDLKAYVALKNALISIINYIEKMNNDTAQTYVTSTSPEGFKEGIFGNIFRLLSGSTSIGLQDENFADLLLNVLVKGSGDIFQEINSVCKNGGYISKPTLDATNKIVKFDNNGNAMRLFVANDRPSASRFCFLLINGNDSDINTKAFGGYTGANKEKDLLVIRQPNVKICSFCGKTTGGKKKTKSNKKMQNKRTKKQIKQKMKRNTRKKTDKIKNKKSKKVI
jgi:hypothetical protein